MRPHLLLVLLALLLGCEATPKKRRPKKQDQVTLEPIHLVDEEPHPLEKKFSPPLFDEKEPNDYPNWAQVLPPGVGARGFINKPRTYTKGLQPDRDVYLFTVPGPGKKILWARLSGVPSIDLFLSVHKRSLTRILLQDGNGPGQDEIIVNLTLAPGSYFFKLGQRWRNSDFLFNASTPYKLQWRLSPPSRGEEIEPNNTRAQANPITIGQTIKGYLSAKNDYDLFALPAGKSPIRIDFTPPKETPATLSLWSDESKTHLWKTPVKKNSTLVLRRLSLGKGKRYLLVAPRKGRYNLEHLYRLKLSYEAPSQIMETEPNDTSAQAMELRGKGGDREGFIPHPGDVDHYRYTVEKDLLINLSLAPFLGGKLTLCIHTKPKMCKTSSTLGEKITFAHQYFKKGIYGISVSSTGSSSTESPYLLSWNTRGAQPGDEREPNNSPKKGNHIIPGRPVRGYISLKGDRDFYWFSLGGSLRKPPRVLVQLTGGFGINPILILRDNYGNVVQEDRLGVYSGVRRVKSALHPNRRYTIEVRDKTNIQFNPKGRYELRLEDLRKQRY